MPHLSHILTQLHFNPRTLLALYRWEGGGHEKFRSLKMEKFNLKKKIKKLIIDCFTPMGRSLKAHTMMSYILSPNVFVKI